MRVRRRAAMTKAVRCIAGLREACVRKTCCEVSLKGLKREAKENVKTSPHHTQRCGQLSKPITRFGESHKGLPGSYTRVESMR